MSAGDGLIQSEEDRFSFKLRLKAREEVTLDLKGPQAGLINRCQSSWNQKVPGYDVPQRVRGVERWTCREGTAGKNAESPTVTTQKGQKALIPAR